MQVSTTGNRDYSTLGKIGEGAFSCVFKTKEKKTGKTYAVKVFRQMFKNADQAKRKREIQVLTKIGHHHNITNLHEILFNPSNGELSLVMDIMGMTTYDLMRRGDVTGDTPVVLCIIYQLLSALDHLHAQGFLHRDIKPENCLIDGETMDLKLADFGMARVMTASEPLTEYTTTRWYRPPEIIMTAGDYGKAADIWPVGCIMYELLRSQPLFPGDDTLDQLDKIHRVFGTPSEAAMRKFKISKKMKGQVSFTPVQGCGLAVMLPGIDDVMLDFMNRLLAYVPRDRISAHDALRHPVFEGVPGIERLKAIPQPVIATSKASGMKSAAPGRGRRGK